MLTHLVSFKYKSETGDEAKSEHRRRLAGLAGLEGVVDLKVGADVVRSARSYDTGLLVVFRDRAALDVYQQHPQHVPVAQFGVGLCEHIVSVDFEA
jgi:hypothetical protein